MKRSAQIGLLVMGALTTTSAAGYFASNHDRDCEQRAINNPQPQPPQDCRRSVWSNSSGHGGSGGSHSFFGSPSSSGSSAGTSGHSSSGTSSASYGGFGGHAGHGGSGT